MACAWPEPPNARLAGARFGVQGTFALAGTENPPLQAPRQRQRLSRFLSFDGPRGLFPAPMKFLNQRPLALSGLMALHTLLVSVFLLAAFL